MDIENNAEPKVKTCMEGIGNYQICVKTKDNEEQCFQVTSFNITKISE